MSDFYHHAKQARRNWIAAEDDLHKLHIDYEDLRNRYNLLVEGYNENLGVIARLEAQKSELDAQLQNAKNLLDIVTRHGNDLGRQNDQVKVALDELRQQAANSAAEIAKLKSEKFGFAMFSLLSKAEAEGMRAMLALARKPADGTDLDKPSPDVPSPDGREVSPLQSAYRVGVARYLVNQRINRQILDEHEAKYGRMPFPVADYIEWLSDPANTDASLLSTGTTEHPEDGGRADDDVVVPSTP